MYFFGCPTIYYPIRRLTLLACRLAFGGGGAGHVRCGGKGGADPLPLVVTFSTFGVDPPPPPMAAPLPIWCLSCSFSTLTLLAEAAELRVFVVGVLSGICGRFWLDTLLSGGGGGLFGGGLGGGATVGRPGRREWSYSDLSKEGDVSCIIHTNWPSIDW